MGAVLVGAKSQRKGRAAELELSRILQGHGYNVEPGRALSYGEVPDLSGLPGVHIECKRCQQVRLETWMEQATKDAQRFQDGVPTIFHRKDRSPWLVTMPLENWLQLYGRAMSCKCGGRCSAEETGKKSMQ